jgi:hypothetical protein
MLFRNVTGNLIEVCRLDYKQDDSYYRYILELYNIVYKPKHNLIDDIII